MIRPMLTQVTQSTPLPFSGEPWVLSTSSAPLPHCSHTLFCFLLPRWDSDSQGSRPIGCQTLVEALKNPELIEKRAVLAFFGGLVGSH